MIFSVITCMLFGKFASVDFVVDEYMLHVFHSHFSTCVCTCVSMCVCVCARACACVRVRARVRACHTRQTYSQRDFSESVTRGRLIAPEFIHSVTLGRLITPEFSHSVTLGRPTAPDSSHWVTLTATPASLCRPRYACAGMCFLPTSASRPEQPIFPPTWRCLWSQRTLVKKLLPD